MIVHLAQADITELAVDALVSPANSWGIMGGGVAGAISRKGGPSIQKEAMSLAPIAVGAAVVTNAGRLWAKQIIHVPTVDEPGQKSTVENVRRATRAALLAASRCKHEVIAIPGIGAGLGGVDPGDAARAIADELRAHKAEKPATVYLVDVDEETVEYLQEALEIATS